MTNLRIFAPSTLNEKCPHNTLPTRLTAPCGAFRFSTMTSFQRRAANLSPVPSTATPVRDALASALRQLGDAHPLAPIVEELETR